jgi:hypothetical protein
MAGPDLDIGLSADLQSRWLWVSSGVGRKASTHMDPFHRFNLEAAVVAGMAILIGRVGPQLANVSRSVRWVHFVLVGIFSLVGIAGPRFVLMFCFGHRRFVDVFAQPNVLGVDAGLMQIITIIFGMAGTVFFVATILLGGLERKAYTVFRWFVLPCACLYPVVMVTASGAVGPSVRAVPLAYISALVLAALGCLALLFYHSKFGELEARGRQGPA